MPSNGRITRRSAGAWARRKRRKRLRLAALACAGLLAAAGSAHAVHLAIDTEGHTTLEQILAGQGEGYQTLDLEQVSQEYIVRTPEGLAAPRPGREARRTSLAYFSQLTDFQLADEESPARVEFTDPGASSAWRPQEAFTAFEIDATVRQVNNFVPSSPVPQGDGTGRPMDFSLMTGDQADNQQRNETLWVRDVLEGGTPMSFNSGSADPADYDPLLPGCALAAANPGIAALQAEAPNYTGVQDYDDYSLGGLGGPGPASLYYDPDQPSGQYSDWPTYTGLMDRAQQITITPEGLQVPWYLTNGNHDVLMQGNEDANRAFEDVAIGCLKILASTQEPGPGVVDPGLLLEPPSAFMLVPPDPEREMVDKAQIKDIYTETGVDDGHGFDFVDPAEDEASNGAASYYAWDPPQTPGFRFISIDTNSEGGVIEQSSNGNIDHPQFQWLEAELEAAQEADKLIVVFGHHPVRSLTSNVRDEMAPACTGGDDGHGHDPNPGCDIDPRPSEPIHLGTATSGATPGESFVDLLDRYPNVVAYVAGHTHEHRLLPFSRSDGETAWWEINTSAVLDWPQQSRLIEIMDNHDGTLSIFGTVLDHASPAAAPAPGDAGGFNAAQLASIGRTLAFNDPQNNRSGEGRGALDRNAELLLPDPRASADQAPPPQKQPGEPKARCRGCAAR